MQRWGKIGFRFASLFFFLSVAFVAYAEPKLFGLKADGEIVGAGRGYPDGFVPQTEQTYFEEYRDMRQRLYFEKFRLGLESESKPYLLEIGGANTGERDQSYYLRSTEFGKYNFEFSWDELPHLYSSSGRMFGTTTAPGVYTLPTPRPTGAQYDTSPVIPRIAMQWDTANFLISYEPTKEWSIGGGFQWFDKSGTRPMGMVFGTPGSNLRQILEPVEQDVYNAQFNAKLAKEKYQLQFGYNLSDFENDLTRVFSDNPNATVNGAFAATATGGSSVPMAGQSALSPDNMANTWNLAGGVDLPGRTRINGSFTYSWRVQNEAFIPHTVNANIPSTNLTLPQSSLEGDVGTILANLTATSRLTDDLTLVAKYRYYDYDDFSDVVVFPAYVEGDRVLINGQYIGERYPFYKQNASLDANWQIIDPVEVTVGMGWERWDRGAHREARVTDEYSPHISATWTPKDWFLMRVAYNPSVKSVNYYDTELVPLQNPLMRKFDEATRMRQAVDFFAQLTPSDKISGDLVGNYQNNNYQATAIGLQDSQNWSVGTDWFWQATERFSIFCGYTREEYRARQRSQYREATQINNNTYIWVARTRDAIDTGRAGFDIAVVPGKVDFKTSWDVSLERNNMDSINPIMPAGGTAAQNYNATAVDFPEIKTLLNRLVASIDYKFTKMWTANLSYILEDFDRDDFTTDSLLPTSGNAIFLGSDSEDYTANIIVATVGFKF